MKTLAMTIGSVAVLRYVKPIERIPMIGKYAPVAEIAGGAALMYFGRNKFVLKGIGTGMLIDGIVKVVDSLPKVV